MEFILPAITTLLVEGFKWLSNKLGQNVAKSVVLLGVLVASAIWAWITSSGLLTSEVIAQFVKYVTLSVGYYEVIWKWLLKQNVIDRFTA